MEASKKKMKFLPHLAFSLLFFLLLLVLLGLFPQGPTLNFPTTAPKIILLSKPTEFPIKAIQQQNKPLSNSISKFNFLISPTALSKSRLLSPIPINA